MNNTHLKELPLFFIIGRPRSGTTLLRSMLDAHPNVKVPPEYPVILDLYNKYGKLKSWTSGDIEAFIADFKATQPKEYWSYGFLRIDEEALRKSIEAMMPDISFEGLIKAFYYHYQSFYEHGEIKLLGDKNPIYASFMPRLLKIFPNAKFIYLTRDYRDNYLSITKFEFEAPNIVLQTYRWKYVTRLFFSLTRNNPGRLIHVRYEDLATDPTEALDRICRFLSIGYDSNMLKFHERSRDAAKLVEKEVFEKFHSGLLKPVTSVGLYRWKAVLQKKDLMKADLTVGRCGEKTGYERFYTNSFSLLQLQIWPMKVYGYLLYKAMSAGEHLPGGLRHRLATFLPVLAKAYHWMFAVKKR
jgi:hypothetical protein